MCTLGHQAAAHFPDMGDPVDLDEEMLDASFQMDPDISERVQQVTSRAGVEREIQSQIHDDSVLVRVRTGFSQARVALDVSGIDYGRHCRVSAANSTRVCRIWVYFSNRP